jgi:hypothetical protein
MGGDPPNPPLEAAMRPRPGSSRSLLAVAYALFSTPFGDCGLAWTACGLAGGKLPERTLAATLLAAGGLYTKARLLALEGVSLIEAAPRLKTWPPAS